MTMRKKTKKWMPEILGIHFLWIINTVSTEIEESLKKLKKFADKLLILEIHKILEYIKF